MHLCLPLFGGCLGERHGVCVAVEAVGRIGNLVPAGSIEERGLFFGSAVPEVEVIFVYEAAEAVHGSLVDGESLCQRALAHSVGVAYLYFHGVFTGLAVVARESMGARVAFSVDNPYGVDAFACELEVGGVGGLVDRYVYVVGIVGSHGHGVYVDIIHAVFGAGAEYHGASKSQHCGSGCFYI